MKNLLAIGMVMASVTKATSLNQNIQKESLISDDQIDNAIQEVANQDTQQPLQTVEVPVKEKLIEAQTPNEENLIEAQPNATQEQVVESEVKGKVADNQVSVVPLDQDFQQEKPETAANISDEELENINQESQTPDAVLEENQEATIPETQTQAKFEEKLETPNPTPVIPDAIDENEQIVSPVSQTLDASDEVQTEGVEDVQQPVIEQPVVEQPSPAEPEAPQVTKQDTQEPEEENSDDFFDDEELFGNVRQPSPSGARRELRLPSSQGSRTQKNVAKYTARPVNKSLKEAGSEQKEKGENAFYFSHPNTGLQEDLEEALMGPVIDTMYKHLLKDELEPNFIDIDIPEGEPQDPSVMTESELSHYNSAHRFRFKRTPISTAMSTLIFALVLVGVICLGGIVINQEAGLSIYELLFGVRSFKYQRRNKMNKLLTMLYKDNMLYHDSLKQQ